MKKIKAMILSFCAMLVFATGAGNLPRQQPGSNPLGEQKTYIRASSRIITYEYSVTIYVDDLAVAIEQINSEFNKLNDGSYLSAKEVNSDSDAKITYYIKTVAYEDFINGIKDIGDFEREVINGLDITNNPYYDEDYSLVVLKLYQKEAETTFGEDIINAIHGSWRVLVNLFKFGVQALIYLFPLILLSGGSIAVIIFINKKFKKRRENKKNK